MYSTLRTNTSHRRMYIILSQTVPFDPWWRSSQRVRAPAGRSEDVSPFMDRAVPEGVL